MTSQDNARMRRRARRCSAVTARCLKLLRHIFALGLATSLFLGGCRPAHDPIVRQRGDDPKPLATVPKDLGEVALRYVAELLELGPRDSGAEGAAAAARWIAGKLEEQGMEAWIDSFHDRTPDGTGVFHNVMAVVPGEVRKRVVLLSHFDTKTGISPDFVGANDGGSSTGLLLALAKHLAEESRYFTFEFSFLDGEECRYAYGPNDGLHGSRRRAVRLRDSGEPVEAVILLDMIGDQDLEFTVPRNGTRELKLLLLDAAKARGCADRITLLNYDILDDHQPFLDAGFPAIDLIDFHYGSRPKANDYWHTEHDTLDKLSAETLQQVGEVVLEMIAILSGSSRE